jgi:transcriptional regulator with XRE-family HTH domain
MNRLEFGVLVASLRDDLHWTQPELAEESGLDFSAISNIERGERRGLLKDGMLLKLAAGLRLTTLERREFLFAASGVSERDILRSDNDLTPTNFNARELIENTKFIISRQQVPFFVTDAYCDIILTNLCSMGFFQLPASLIATAGQIVGGCNMMRVLFDPASNFRDMVGEDWEKQALLNLRYFRRTTLRYRAKPYYAKLMQEFLNGKKYPLFDRYWRKMLADDSDEFTFLAIYTMNSHEYGKMEYAGVESFLAMTPYGELYVNHYLPLDENTAKAFNKIFSKCGEGCIEFAPFPDDRKI